MAKRYSSYIGSIATVTVVAALASLPASAMAQAADQQSIDDDGGEIVVTATKTGQTVLEAPVSVGVVTGETIRQTGATNFAELSTLLPSVVFSSQQSPIQSSGIL